jgi:hypothetical protein
MTDLTEELQRLELLEYLDVLVAEGFDTWETVSDIAESDLNSLNVKIGHRRKLQRAIAESRSPVYNHRPPIARTKRKYARHPKSDEHAPGRPLSAYVIFANHVRESLEGQGLSFTEIAMVRRCHPPVADASHTTKTLQAPKSRGGARSLTCLVLAPRHPTVLTMIPAESLTLRRNMILYRSGYAVFSFM